LPEAIDFLEGHGLRNWQYRHKGMKFLNIRCVRDGDLDITKANSISLEEFEKTYAHFGLKEDDIVISLWDSCSSRYRASRSPTGHAQHIDHPNAWAWFCWPWVCLGLPPIRILSFRNVRVGCWQLQLNFGLMHLKPNQNAATNN